MQLLMTQIASLHQCGILLDFGELVECFIDTVVSQTGFPSDYEEIWCGTVTAEICHETLEVIEIDASQRSLV